MIKIKIVYGISIKKISELNQRAVRTPHVGNECLHGLVHEQLSVKDSSKIGIVNIYYDRTTKADIYHHPSYIVVDGRKVKIALTENHGCHILTTHLNVESHMFRLNLIYPDNGRMTYFQFIVENKKHYDELVITLGKKCLEKRLWQRFVEEDGKVVKKTPTSWGEMLKEGIFQITSAKSGWVMPNMLNILSMFYIDDKIYRSGVVHQISGAEMYKYIKLMNDDIQELWSILVEKQGSSEDLEVLMYPTGNARFAAFDQADYHKLELMFQKREEIKKFTLKKSEYFKALRSKPDQDMMRGFQQEGDRLNRDYQDICWENRNILYSMSDASFTSQYDMVPGQRLLIHPFCLNATIKGLDDMIGEMGEQIKKREKRLKRNFNR